MAGPRKAQYVSIPMGPGVLTNTTGRGAKTRINYMNWDRWQDASWVRWHKLLAEKQGGWAYQALVPAATYPPLLLGSPALLLHLNAVLTPVAASLLLHFDAFVDSSINNLSVTAVPGGTAFIDTSAPKFGTGAMNVGVGFGKGGVQVPSPAAGPLDLSLGDWTIEGWVKWTNLPGNNQMVAESITNGVLGWAIEFEFLGSGFGNFGLTVNDTNAGGGGVNATTADFLVIPGTWYYITAQRQGGNVNIALNGVFSANTALNPVHSIGNKGTTAIGSVADIANKIEGQYDDWRITKAALYPGNFTPPIGPLNATPTVALPSFVDTSPYNWPMTASGGTITIDTANPKFGNGALQLLSAADVLSTPIVFASPLDLSQGDFTLEFWVFSTALGPRLMVDYSNGQTAGFYIEQTSSTNVEAFIWNGSGYSTITGALTQNVYTAIALVRQGGTFTFYVNGVAVGTAAIPGNIGPMGGLLGIGGGFTTSLLGDIDELRLTLSALYTANYTPATAENTLGLPNVLGSPNPPDAFAPSQYQGIARDIHDWSSIDGQFWVTIGTHLKLYVVNQGTIYDITPIRATSNVTNALTTASGGNAVTVVDIGHKANTGDFVDISGASPLAGLLISGPYEATVVDPNTYTILATLNATSGATGGGNFSIAYEIYTGLGANGQLLGYGTGPYGLGTYGTPRPAGTGVFARMRTWSLDNFGQDLIASESDGEIYIWERVSGPNTRAQLIINAPTGCQRVLVDAAQRVVIALGCTDVTSAFDAMLVRWCTLDDITDWFPTAINTAGDYQLTAGSRIVTGLKTKGQNLIFTDTTLYRMVFVGGTDIYDFIPAGLISIVGPNAAVDVDGVGYCMGFDNIYNYSGTLNLLACDVWETVFDPNLPTSLNRAQAEGVYCYTYEPKTEITWLYQSIGGAFSVVFTGPPAQSAINGTLTAPFTGPTGLYDLQFSDQSSRPVQLTNGQTTATWLLPLTGNVGVGATFIGNDRYVTYNWEDGVWYCGAWNRTCAQGRAPAMGGFPYGVNAGFLYQHEIGTDAVELAGTSAIPFFMESLDITTGGAKSEYTMGGSDARFAIGGSDSHLRVISMIPDWKYFGGAMNVYLKTKDRPQDAASVVSGPVPFTVANGQIDIDAHGSQIVMRFDNFTAGGGAPSLGCKFRMGIWQALATPYAKR